jgi:hypothetical protein
MQIHTIDSISEIDEPLRIMHHHPGYIRAQAKTFVEMSDGDSILAAARTAAESVTGFIKWFHNPNTGSIVIEYTPGVVSPEDILDRVAESAGLRGVVEDFRSSDHRTQLVGELLDTVQDINGIVYEATGRRADLRELIPLALMATSAVSFLLGEDRGVLPKWDSSLYKSYRIFMQFHRQDVRTREKRERKHAKNSRLRGERVGAV